MPLKISAFPKCYLDQIAGDRTMSVFDWIEMARSLDADGLEMYDGFFTSLDDAYLDRVGEAIRAAGFAMPMLCCSPDFTNPDADARKRAVDREAELIRVARRLGGPRDRLPRPLGPALSRRSAASRGWSGSSRASSSVLPVAREHDVVLGLENHYKDGFWKYPEFAQKQDVFLELLARDPRPRRTSACSTTRRTRSSPATTRSRCCEAVADRVVSMHASDRYLAEGATLDDLRQTDGTLGYSPNLRHGVTGKGLNDYDAIFRILAEHDYRGWVSIEDGMNGMDEMAESLAFLRRMVAKYFPD